MDTPERPPVSAPLRSKPIPIAQLSPDVEGIEEKSVHSTVTLLWPFSSSTKSFSLLLAEPDFRLRRSNGQVKVHFQGKVAEQVAKSQVGIGDSVYLSLVGSRFKKNDAAIQTPGRGVPWDIHFDNSVLFEVWRDSKLLSTVKLDGSSSPTPCTGGLATPSTPIANGFSNATGPDTTTNSASWKSPAFLSRSRGSFGFVGPVSDPFADEDGFVPGKGRKRPRFSMRSNEWRVIDEPERPEDRDPPADWTAMFDEDQWDGSDIGEESVVVEVGEMNGVSAVQEQTSIVNQPGDGAPTTMVPTSPEANEISSEQPAEQMKPEAQFLRPNAISRTGGVESIDETMTHLPTDTPRLQPVPSPGLPIPSPLITNTNSPSGYFTAVAAQIQVTPPVSTVLHAVPESEISTISHTQVDLEQMQTDEERDVTPSVTRHTLPLSETVSTTHEEPGISIGPSVDHTVDPMEGAEPQGVGQVLAKHAEFAERLSYTIETRENEGRLRMEESEGEHEMEDVEEVEYFAVEEEQSERQDDDDIEMGEGSSVEREDSVKADGLVDDEQASELEGRVWADDDRDLSETSDSDDEGDVEEVVEISEDDSEWVQGEALSPEEGMQQPEDRVYDDEYDEYDEEEDEEDEEEIEEPEVDYDEEDVEEEDERRYDSESDTESDYRENLAGSNMPPKSAEPEIIVLDSESDDEPPPQHNVRSLEHSGSESDEESELNEFSAEEEGDMASVEELGGMGEIDELEDTGDEDIEQVSMESEQEYAEFKPGNQEPPGDSSPDEHNYYIVDQTEVQGEISETELPRSQEQSLEFHELQDSREDIEEISSTPIHGSGYDALECLSPTSHSNMGSETVPQPFDMAIDPKLYDFEHSREDVNMDASGEHNNYPDSRRGEMSLKVSETDQKTDLGLQLDGQFSPQIVPTSAVTLPNVAYPPQAQQLVTSNLSQPLVLENDLPELNAPVEMPPTPDMTQNQPSSQFATNISSPLQGTASESSGIAKEDGIPLAERIKQEISPVPDNRERLEIEETPAVESTEMPTLQNQDQALQASIEVDDESDGGLDDRVCLVPVDRNYPGLRSKLSYFAPLATLIDHYNALTDTISVVSEVRPAFRATTGKKDFILTLQLTDPSMAGTTVDAQIIRPYKAALPSVNEGDGILLRNFRVKSFNHSIFLVSEATSAWAVFSGSPESPDEPQINGPPVEYGSQEAIFATDIRQWYQEGGMAMVADYQLQASVDQESREATPTSSLALSDSGSLDSASREVRADTSLSNRGSRRRKSHRRITIHELRDGRRYAEVGSPSGKDSIHELRDGTVYANL